MLIIKLLLRFYLYFISIFFVGRAGLFLLYFDRFSGSNVNYYLSFLYGLRMDTITASVLLVIPALVLTLTPKIFSKVSDIFLRVYFLITVSMVLYVENATFPFFAQYDVRPNYLFVEYLEYPREVVSMIAADYPVELAVAFTMMFGAGYLLMRKMKDMFPPVFWVKVSKRAVLLLPVLIVLFIGIRSSFGHRPANISDAMYSSNRVVNEITKNSLYSIGYTVYSNNAHGEKAIKKYGQMEIDEAMSRVENILNIKSDAPGRPFYRMNKSHFKSDDTKNLVILIEESFGYQFVNDETAPNMNRLKNEGIWFDDLFSNGTRSIRGLAGMTSGIFSIPGKGVLKRNKSQNGFFTASSLLKPYGYRSLFFYGGESRFDNMKGWFSGNGFDEIIDQDSIENPSFVNSWGVSDEDLLDTANKRFSVLHNKGQKFVSIIFSTSNHTPFDVPLERIDPVRGVSEKSVENAVKYADYAIGRFIGNARKEAYYSDTVFVIVADHNVRVYGDDMVPVNMFHIPGLILGGSISPVVINTLSTQPDLLATAFDLTGIDLYHPVMGKSVFDDSKQEVSLMQFNDFYALRAGDEVAVVRPGKEPLSFKYRDEHLYPAQINEELRKDTLAFIVVLNYLYDKKRYN